MEEKVVDKNEFFNEKVQLEPEESLEVPKVEKKRVRLTIGVKPEGGVEKKKKVPEGGNQATTWRWCSRYHTCDGTWLR